MRAVVQNGYGGPEILSLADVTEPLVGPDSVLVRVAGAGVNPVDRKIGGGAFAEQVPTMEPVVPGWDVSGTVERVGPAVTTVAVGDRVIAYARKDVIGGGTYAELVSVPERAVCAAPTTRDLVESAALPLAGLTAWQCLLAVAAGEGDTVLVHAAAGGVGYFTVQLARQLGASRVIGTASEANHEFLREVGVEPVTYGEGLADRVRALEPDGVDVVVDAIGGDATEASWGLLAPGGRLVSVVDRTVTQRGGHYVFVRPDAAQLSHLVGLVDSGLLRIEVEKVLPLEEAAQAWRLLAEGHVRGKVVLAV